MNRYTRAVGSPDLEEIYNTIRNELNTPAVDLVHISLKLDQLGLFPQKDVSNVGKEFKNLPLAASVLRHLVITHFYLYNVHFQVKQSICSQLDISYERLQKLNSANRLLSAAPQRSEKYLN